MNFNICKRYTWVILGIRIGFRLFIVLNHPVRNLTDNQEWRSTILNFPIGIEYYHSFQQCPVKNEVQNHWDMYIHLGVFSIFIGKDVV